MKGQAMLELLASILLASFFVLLLFPALLINEDKVGKAISKSKSLPVEAYCNMRFIDGNSFTAVTVFDENADINSIECLSPLVEKTVNGLLVSGEEPWF